jgi:hypothetical protein
MLLRLATLGALGYAAFRYYDQNREQVDGTLRRFASRGSSGGQATEGDDVEVAGGPLSDDAQLVPAGEGPLA